MESLWRLLWSAARALDGFKTNSGSWPEGSLQGGISPKVSTLHDPISRSYFVTGIRMFITLSLEHFRDLKHVDAKQSWKADELSLWYQFFSHSSHLEATSLQLPSLLSPLQLFYCMHSSKTFQTVLPNHWQNLHF